jgi:eukaryotic-like serine/threonine-protein kinase
VLSPGTRLGPYEILSPLGAGGMGEVFKARDTRLDRIVAIKILPDALAGDPQFRDRFDREARTISQLDHPYICALYDVGEHNRTAYLVMQYLEGETLADRLTKGALPLDQALQVAIQTADALAAAHKAGIVHRDLKPGNIMLTKSGAKLLDFGLAKTRTSALSAAHLSMLPTTPPITQQGAILGTFQYMAPEQLEGREADARTDIFAFGAVVYEMLTGKRAFEGKSQATLIAAIIANDPPPMSAAQPLTPPAVDRLVKKCLSKDADRRWQTARDLLDELKWIAEGDTAVAPLGVRTRNPWLERAAWITIVVGVLSALFILSVGSATQLNSAIGTKIQLSVNPPAKTTFAMASNVTVSVPMFALSPDGHTLVFSAATAGARPSLWRRPLGEVAAQILSGTEGAQYPFWSPDGAWIAFFAEGKLEKIPAAGGPVQVVLDSVPDPRGGSWGRDNTILVGNGSDPLLRVASAGGGLGTVVTKLEASRKEASHRWPVWLPDGRHFLYTVRSTSFENSGVYVSSIDGPPRRLSIRADGSVGYVAPGYVLFPAGDTLIGQRLDTDRFELSGQPVTVGEHVGVASNGFGSFSASETGVIAYAGTLSRTGRLVWFDRGGNQFDAIGIEGDYSDIRLSPDDQRLAASLVDPKTGNADIWLTDLARGNTSRFTFGPRLNSGPIWSHDGSRIVFRTTRKGGQVEFYQKSAASGGSELPVLLEEAQRAVNARYFNVVVSDWSSDGGNLLYSLSTTSKTDLWLLPMSGDPKPVRFLVTQSDNMHGTFSPDGRLVAYSSNESGRFEVYVQTFPLTDRKWTVSTTGGFEPRWRADGREIYYLSDDRKLMAVSVEAGPTFGVPKPLFQTRVLAEQISAYRTHYAPNRDGSRFLVNTQSTDTPPTSITIVLNWTPKP